MPTRRFSPEQRTIMSSRLWIEATRRAATRLKFGEKSRSRRTTAGVLLGSGAVLFAFAFQPALSAQTLRLSSAAARPGDTVTIEISLASPDGSSPQVLQWETTIPTAQL